MNKRQFWSALKEIMHTIDEWNQDKYKENKDDLKFAQFLPVDGDWNKLQKYVIRIKIEKESVYEEEKRT